MIFKIIFILLAIFSLKTFSDGQISNKNQKKVDQKSDMPPKQIEMIRKSIQISNRSNK